MIEMTITPSLEPSATTTRGDYYSALEASLRCDDVEGRRKVERTILSVQGAHVETLDEDGARRSMLNLCSNNYLGLAGSPVMSAAAKAGIDAYGYGMSSVRFICGTQLPHRQLERRLADWLGTEAAILFPSCFDANAGLFEALAAESDTIVSDALNHASIVDGIRLSKARRARYPSGDIKALERCLREAQGSRARFIVTDGVFSMDGVLADLRAITALADRYEAFVIVDDSHAVGLIGPGGRGTPALHGVAARVDLMTGTFGKALGGAAGGYVAGRAVLIERLRQAARPYLFSNALPPVVAAATLSAIDLVEHADDLRARLDDNTRFWRGALGTAGFVLGGVDHPIVPVMIGDAVLAGQMAMELQARGILVVNFAYPVVPKEQARLRTQISAAHGIEDLAWAAEQFVEVGRNLGVVL